jgi:hypothetical protein
VRHGSYAKRSDDGDDVIVADFSLLLRPRMASSDMHPPVRAPIEASALAALPMFSLDEC